MVFSKNHGFSGLATRLRTGQGLEPLPVWESSQSKTMVFIKKPWFLVKNHGFYKPLRANALSG